MAGVAVLQPQDFLNIHNHRHHQTNRHRLFPAPAMKTQSSSARNPNPGPAVSRSANRPKRSPQKSSSTAPLKKDHTCNNTNSKPTTDLVLGQVKILKRGETLPPTPAKEDNLKNSKKKESDNKVKKGVKPDAARPLNDLVLLSSTDRLGPEPDCVPKHIRIGDFYAGSAFVTSPPPSSLPLPAFFKKKSIVLTDDNNSGNATSDLIKLLKLDL